MSNSIADLARSRLILAVGTNTTESHPVLALSIKRALAHGARLLVADPRRTEIAALAHRHLRLRVGSDTALFNAMGHVILEEGLLDAPFVEAHVTGLGELRAFLAPQTPRWAEGITGISAAEIAEAAREYARARPAAIAYTLGVTEHSCGTGNVQSLSNLAVLCGNLGVPGGGINPLRGQNNVQGAGDAGCLPTNLPGYQKILSEEARSRWERLWGVKLPLRQGITKTRAVEEMLEGGVRGAWIMGENTVVSDANAGKTARALAKLELLVVQDLFLTETARLAHVVLPAASFAETDGTFVNTERRVQRVRRAIPPPGEAREDWKIVSDVSERLGFPMRYGSAAEIWDELASETPVLAGISYARIEERGIQWPCPSNDHPGTSILHTELREGKQVAHLQCIPYVPPAEQPDAEYPYVLTTGRRREAYHTQTQTGRSSALRALLPEEALEIHPEDAARLGLRDGDMARARSRRGEVTVRVAVTDRSPQGVVFLSFHFPGQVMTNLLTNDALDPVTETPEFKACAVAIEAAEPEYRGPSLARGRA